MERLFATLELRSTDDELRQFEGIANSAALDDHGTIVEPNGARFSLPIPLLWFHDQQNPVGEITHAELRSGNQWFVRGTIRKVTEPGRVKDATDQAWHSVKYKLVRGLSIGFKSLKEKGNRFIEWAWRELSLVTIPSNQEASIVSVRSAYVAASGASPGVSGIPTTNPKRKQPMTIQEQITQHENSRAAKVARQSALMDAAGAAGETLGETEAEEYDTLTREVEATDGHLARLSSLQRANEAAATPVNGTSTETASQARGGVAVVRTRANEAPGLGFARYLMALYNGKGNADLAAIYAKRTWGEPETAEIVKWIETPLAVRAAVAAGTTQQATWAAPLVPTNFLNEFLELLRPATIIGRIPGLRRVPFNMSMPTQTAGSVAQWVGETKPKPVSKLQFAAVTLGMAKVADIVVLSKELVKSSSPAAQEVVRDDMIKGIAQFLDKQFIDDSVSAVANVNPASITNGVTGTGASGTTQADARSDIGTLLTTFGTNNLNLGGVVFLMSETTALVLSLMVNPLGQPAFPGMSISGGTLFGLPVVASNAITDDIIAAHAPSILLADEGGVEIDVSEQASVQMDDSPDDPTINTTVLISLWQNNLVGLRAERFINWAKARTGAVDRITSVAYVA
jgi:HK97 family phage major capsid protein/HK97 family phage prohead protease